jgi:hypothetical protein
MDVFARLAVEFAWVLVEWKGATRLLSVTES